MVRRCRRPRVSLASRSPDSRRSRLSRTVRMRDLYPGYDVLAKRHTPSWNEQTREVVARRLAIGRGDHRFFAEEEWPTLCAICERIVPQPTEKQGFVPVAALV